jgi:hypothetical protein
MYLTIFLLLTISASRELAMSLNAPFNLAIKLDLVELKGTSYTYADLVFVSVYGLIKNGPRLLKPIYKSIIAILSNLAPYTKCLCKEGCDGLMYLVQVFANNRFLMEKEDNCKTLGSLIEAINYLIAYHDETNHYLQIQLMKYQTMFDYLDNNLAEIGVQKQNQPIIAIQSSNNDNQEETKSIEPEGKQPVDQQEQKEEQAPVVSQP